MRLATLTAWAVRQSHNEVTYNLVAFVLLAQLGALNKGGLETSISGLLGEGEPDLSLRTEVSEIRNFYGLDLKGR